MYTIEIPDTIHQLLGIFYRLGIWSDKDLTTFVEDGRKLFSFVYFMSFDLSIAVGALTSNDNDERVYLTVISVILHVQCYRMWIILWRKKEFLFLINQFGIHSTNDREAFIQTNNKLNVFSKFVRCYMFSAATGSFLLVILFPLTNRKHLIFNIALPGYQHNSDTVFWMAAAFVGGGFFCSLVCAILTKMIWYSMLSISLDYKILGNRLTHMGTIRTGSFKVSLAAKQKLYFEDVIAAIQTYDNINGKLAEFSSFFGNMFFMQIATASVCICGPVYTLAFSSHDNFLQDLMYLFVIAYTVFDIFMVMYLGNEIQLSSDELSHCVYESNWIEQSPKCKKCIVILMERLKRPQQLIVGKLYPLNLQTFTSIVNGAYSLFNILQNIR